MPRSRDLITFSTALLLHAAVAYALLKLPPRSQRSRQVIEMEVRRPPPPVTALTPPEPVLPPPAPPPPTNVVTRRKLPTLPQPVTPPPNAEPPKEQPKEPPKPVFGVTMDSVTDAPSSFSVPVGNTTMIDPAKSAPRRGPVQPLPASPPPTTPPERAYKPVSALHIKTMPVIDGDACGRGVPYPEQALKQGIQGDVILRVALDENGRVREVKLLSGLGYGLDEAASRALRTSAKCKFSPAIANDGSPVPYVIPSYTFHFELPQ